MRSIGQSLLTGIDKVAAVLVETVKNLESSILVTFAEYVFPGLAELHGTQTYW